MTGPLPLRYPTPHPTPRLEGELELIGTQQGELEELLGALEEEVQVPAAAAASGHHADLERTRMSVPLPPPRLRLTACLPALTAMARQRRWTLSSRGWRWTCATSLSR